MKNNFSNLYCISYTSKPEGKKITIQLTCNEESKLSSLFVIVDNVIVWMSSEGDGRFIMDHLWEIYPKISEGISSRELIQLLDKMFN